ncbi:DUF948 domain-containing protein [Bacillus sp. E(2018)]|nr:DUF948 domain-containing protein [Bacillus sp. E(2018)]
MYLHDLLKELDQLSETLKGLGKNVDKLSRSSKRLKAQTNRVKRK